MKKALLTLGSIASVATPIIAAVSCGDNDTKTQSVASITGYNMKTIYDMKAADKTKLASLIVDDNKTKTFDEFKALVKAQSMDAANEKIINDIMDHYKDAAGKVTVGWHVLHFVLASTDDAQLALAAFGWVMIDGDDDRSQATAAVKAYILNGTIDTKEMAKSIIDKFAGREGDKFNTPLIQMALKVDEVNHKFIKGAGMAASALQAMGGEETLKAILDHGTGQTWTIEDAPAANPAG